jgi:hypothetical protein
MANIDNLNFKVILDDRDFNKRIRDLERDARKFNTNMSNLLHVRKASAQISQQEVANNRRALQSKVDEAKAQERINREKIKTEGLQKKINAQIERGARGSKQMSASASSFMGTFWQMAAIGGMVGLIRSLVQITGEFELQKATLAAMLDDLGAAEHILGKLKDLSVQSPFTYKELGSYAKQLTAFSVPKEELYETTNMIADLSAGLGVAADRLILAYGQVKSAAFLRGQEVRQFTEAGIPLLKELAEEFEKLEGRAVSVGEVFDRISTRQVSFEMVRDVLKEMTEEGGKFYQMQQIQAGTIWGKIQTLKGQWQIALDEMGKKNNTVIHGAIDGLTNLVKNWEKVGKWIRTIIIMFGAYKAAVALAWVVQKAFVAVDMVKTFIMTAKSIGMSVAALKSFALALSSTLPLLALVGGAIYAISTNSSDAKESTHDLNAELGDLHDNAVLLQHSFDADIKTLQSLTKGTQAYRDALKDINDTYGDYLPKLLTESSSYEEIEAAAEKAKHAILEIQRQKAIDSMRDQVARVYETEAANYNKVMSHLTESGYALFNKLIERGKILKDQADLVIQSDIFGVTWQFDPGTALSVTAEEFRKAVNYILLIQEEERKIAERVDQMYNGNSYSTLNELKIVKAAETRKEASLKALKEEEIATSEYRERELEITKNYYRELINEFEKIKNVTLADKYRKELEELENFEKSWRGKVQKLLADRGHGEYRSFGLWPTEYTSSTDFLEKIVKDYKEVSETLEGLHFDPNTEQSLKEQKKIIEAIADLLNIDLTTGKRKGRGGKSELEKKIDALSALKKAYDDLKTLNLSDTTIVGMLKDAFPDIKKTYGDSFIEALDFTNRILEFATELKATEPDRAHSILQSLGLDNLSNDKKVIKEAIDAAKKYFEAIRKLKTSDFSIDGEGVAFDIGKIANQLSNKFNDIELNAKKTAEIFKKIDLNDPKAIEAARNTFEKEFGEGSWDAFYAEFLSKGEDAIKEFSNMEMEFERKLAQEKLNDIASKYVKESLENIDLSHWGEKSINQIEAIRQRIADLMEQGIVLPQSTIDKLGALGLSMEDLQKKILELFGEKYDTATIEKFKALGKVINETSSIAKTLGSDLEKLGETLDDDMLKGLGKSLQTFEQLAKMLTECDSLMQSIGNVTAKTMDDIEKEAEEAKLEGTFESMANSSDLITLAIKLAASLISKFVTGINESQKALIDAREAAIEYEHALKQIEYNDMKDSYATIFGTDEYRQAVDAMKMAAKYQRDIAESQEKIGTSQKEINKYMQDASNGWSQYSKGARETWNEVKELGKGDILVDARNGWQKFWGTGNELVKSINIADFIDEEGMLKGEELRAWMKENGEHISQDNKDMLNQMLNDYDLYTQAVEDATAYLSNVFGNVADDMADAFIEAFKASGEAALDYADIMDDVATEIARSVIKSMLIDEIFSPEKIKEISGLLLAGDQAGALSIVDKAMMSAQELTPRIQAFLESLEPYFNMGEDERNNLASGIKGITEDTANLLASYLNAIRADVSYSKTLWERMDATTQQIATMLAGFSAPTLIDYQKKIEANTYNTAMATQGILSELRSVITLEGGNTAIRTYA